MDPQNRPLGPIGTLSGPMIQGLAGGDLTPADHGMKTGNKREIISSHPEVHQGQGADPDRALRFDHVVLPHLDDAYTLARWLTGNRSDAEDVVQDACLRAFRGISGFRDGDARAWVLTIVRRTAYSWLDRNRPSALVRIEGIELVDRAQFGEPDVETPEAALIAKSEARLLEAAIAALPVPFRETVVLRDVQGLAYREIADVTGVPIGTVMSRLARARHQLITAMANNAAA